jgi:hypothetical protein
MNTQLVIKYQGLKDAIIDSQKSNIANGCPFETIEEAIEACLEPYFETSKDYGAANSKELRDILIQEYPYIENYFPQNK